MLYGYSRGVRSARKIERACEEDVAFKTIAMLEMPDHATIARFVERHERALGELFGQVLGLCAQAGLVRPGVVAIDGTRLAGNASRESTLDFGAIAREILAEAKAIDEAEDELYGEARGDELPEQLRTREGRAEFFRRAREQRDREREAAKSEQELVPRADPQTGFGFDVERIVARGYRRSGPPSGRASTTTAASPRQARSSLLTFRVTGHTALRRPVELRWSLFFCMRMRGGTVPRGGSSGRAGRMWPTR